MCFGFVNRRECQCWLCGLRCSCGVYLFDACQRCFGGIVTIELLNFIEKRIIILF